MNRSLATSLTPNQRKIAGLDDLMDNLFDHRFIGFNDIFRDVSHLASQKTGYPPHDVVQIDDNAYRIDVAVAGFSSDDINITMEENRLTVYGNTTQVEENTFLHRGIARRAFELSFRLGEHHEVGEVKITNGVLSIPVNRIIPEEKKPKKIPIST